MTLDEYIDDYNQAPYDLTEFADGAKKIEDCPELADAAKAFLDAQRRFQDLLDAYDVEIG